MPRRSVISWRRSIASEAAQQVLRNTLRSACDVIGADRGFILAGSRDRRQPRGCLRMPYRSVRTDQRGARSRRAGPASGHAARHAGAGRSQWRSTRKFQRAGQRPVAVALPLDLGSGLRGTLCLLREDEPRALSELDAEILGALADQAALALRAASQKSALSKLAASLHEFATKHAELKTLVMEPERKATAETSPASSANDNDAAETFRQARPSPG